ncbi:low molecular weight protein-tyrosine-phosphatase [Mesomycoplasma moatsii]|uniref:low molecular weight protein-tyrosine-phosphatase n=1 Tax=Mesomycoplasma moatsii TaxID=171287 RepID=UPI0003B71D5B
MKIVFVCLGNICRSPMAEFIAKYYTKRRKIKNLEISSCGTANYHEGQQMHHETKVILDRYDIPRFGFRAKVINKEIFDSANYILVMDNLNYEDVVNKFGQNKKILKITDFCSLNYNEVPDPWYSKNFEETYEILLNSINNFFMWLKLND